MIKINLETVRFEQGSDEEFAKKLAKVQARTKVRNISYEDACITCYDMVRYLQEILPGTNGVGAKTTHIVSSYNIDQYRGIPMGTRITIVKHTKYAEVCLDRYPANGQQSFKFDLDISNCLNQEKVKEFILKRALRYYELINGTKIVL